MLKKFTSVRFILSMLLLLSVMFAGYSIYYKVKYWGFEISPKTVSDVWTIEAHISFEPTGEPVTVSLTTPGNSNAFKILEEDVVAPGYKVKKVNNETSRMILTAPAQTTPQDIYYRVMLFDNIDTRGKIKAPQPAAPKMPIMDEQTLTVAQQIIKLADQSQQGDDVSKIIRFINQVPADPTVQSYLPIKKAQKDIADAVRNLLSIKKIPNRVARGFKLEESKKSLSPDLMLQAYIDNQWKTYNLKDGAKGLPENFVIFQRGGESLIDVMGGENSVIKFSVMKSVTSSLSLASRRAKLAGQKSLFDYSIYNLPLAEQNTLKWLSIFPLAILIIVLLRNVVGVKTMGTFTPMLLSMSLVKTGFWPGLICFGVIIGIGLLIRFVLSKLNLLLVPRISAVVIVVIIIMQMLTVLGYQFKLNVALSAVFFPIIIMAWIIERASITWEEEGAINAGKEIFYSLVAAIVTYFIISSEYIRHIMFAFNELNLVILFVVMLLGTYTGYRLTELRRFKPLVKE